MDKDVCKRLLRDAGMPIVPFEVVTARRWAPEPDAVRGSRRALGHAAVRQAGQPRVVAGREQGELTPAELDAAIERALALDTKILIERGIDGREIECAVLGNETPQASVPGEIVPGEAFYSYEDKYAADSAARLLIPAPLSDECAGAVRATARCARSASSSAAGMARVDFFLENGDRSALYINELNTIPGFTSISMYPKLWEASGLTGPALVTRLIELALERHAQLRAADAHRASS